MQQSSKVDIFFVFVFLESAKVDIRARKSVSLSILRRQKR